MRVAKAFAVAALMLAVIGPVRGAAAGAKHPTIFVANHYDVTAYPAGSSGDVAPIAVTTDMAYPSGIARDVSGRIYVANFATNTVTVYAANANGNVPPIAVIGGSKTRLTNPTGIALDASGRIYVLNGAKYRNGIITVYPPLGTSTGILNQTPIAAIAGSKTLLNYPTGIALDSLGNIYVANEFGGPVVPHDRFDRGRLTVYLAGSSGNIAPIATISGAATGLAYPVAIALDSGGNIYVANEYTANASSGLGWNASITVYPAGSKGNAPPSAIITGDNTDLDYPQGIALDPSRNLYAVGYVNGVGRSVNVYPAGSNGDASPTATIAGADTGLSEPHGIVLDSSGSLYVSNSNGGTSQSGSVTVYPAGSTGDAVPAATIISNLTALQDAARITVDSTGKIFVANGLGGPGDYGSVTIYPAGSYAAGPPIATIAGDNTGFTYPLGIGLDSSDNIFVMNSDNAITVYPAGSSGDVTPKATINIDSRGKSFPTGMAVSARGDIYVVNSGRPASVAVYPAGSDGNAKPIAVITGPDTKLTFPSAVAVDHSGDIYVTDQGPEICTNLSGCIPTGSGSVNVYAPGSNGDVMPIASISGANTGLGIPYEIALDSNENIYVLDGRRFRAPYVVPGQGNERTAAKDHTKGGVSTYTQTVTQTVTYSAGPDSILIFAAGSNGDTAPIAVIGGPFTGLYDPSGIAIGPSGQ
jgi:sugar lactone lactonase YvrE